MTEAAPHTGPVARGMLVVIGGYQRMISPFLGANCRYHPTCSAYARQAIVHHGAARGGWMAVRRLGRCHPFHEGGYDPVPAVDNRHSAPTTPSGNPT